MHGVRKWRLTHGHHDTRNEVSQSEAGVKSRRKTARAAAKPADAITLLKADHKEVKTYFKQYESLEDDGEKQALSTRSVLRSPFMPKSRRRFIIPRRARR